jgi:small GTP-binding protein
MLIRPVTPAVFKVVFIGDASTGKTSIIRRYCDNAFTDDQPPTIGSAFLTRRVTTDNGNIDLQIWDTAGEERYRSLVPMYSRGARVAIIVFDVSNRDSFLALDSWADQIHSGLGDQCKIIVAANKCDLSAVVAQSEIDEWSELHSIIVMRVSAATDSKINELFDSAAKMLPAKAYGELTQPDQISNVSTSPKSGDCC